MTHLAINPENRFAFFSVKENFLEKLFGKQRDNAQKSTHKVIVEASAQHDIMTCKCCSWKGKSSETKKEFLFINKISELELFCPKCNSYLGFISDEA